MDQNGAHPPCTRTKGIQQTVLTERARRTNSCFLPWCFFLWSLSLPFFFFFPSCLFVFFIVVRSCLPIYFRLDCCFTLHLYGCILVSWYRHCKLEEEIDKWESCVVYFRRPHKVADTGLFGLGGGASATGISSASG